MPVPGQCRDDCRAAEPERHAEQLGNRQQREHPPARRFCVFSWRLIERLQARDCNAKGTEPLAVASGSNAGDHPLAIASGSEQPEPGKTYQLRASTGQQGQLRLAGRYFKLIDGAAKSVPGAVATGSSFLQRRGSQKLYPVATAPGTDFNQTLQF